jgi:two-component system sensor histidine kinase HydH
MTLRRFPPLALAIVLVAAALVATTYTSSRAVNHATIAVRDGEAVTAEQAVRGDLNELDDLPAQKDLDDILTKHAGEGLRYLALLDGRGRIEAQTGTPFGEPRAGLGERRPLDVQDIRGRIRVDMRIPYRRGIVGMGPRQQRIAFELEPLKAEELRSAAQRTLAIGGIAALMLIGVSIALTRRELRRSAEVADRERERRLASLGEMSAVLAHEIKNPLASLKGNAQLLAASLPTGDKPRRQADRVVDEAVRLEKLTQDLLAFVRTGQLQRAPVSPAAIARELAAEHVQVEDAGAPATWSLDAGRLREVLANLVDNALAAGPPVTVRVLGERGHLVYEVIDRGPGVPPADRDKIFEPFFTGKTRGTGLGLAIAKRMVELHGGTIAVTGGQPGAVFRIEIPEA